MCPDFLVDGSTVLTPGLSTQSHQLSPWLGVRCVAQEHSDILKLSRGGAHEHRANRRAPPLVWPPTGLPRLLLSGGRPGQPSLSTLLEPSQNPSGTDLVSHKLRREVRGLPTTQLFCKVKVKRRESITEGHQKGVTPKHPTSKLSPAALCHCQHTASSSLSLTLPVFTLGRGACPGQCPLCALKPRQHTERAELVALSPDVRGKPARPPPGLRSGCGCRREGRR